MFWLPARLPAMWSPACQLRKAAIHSQWRSDDSDLFEF